MQLHNGFTLPPDQIGILVFSQYILYDRKYWLITQEAVAPSRHDWKIVDWDVKPQHKQKKQTKILYDNH